AVTVGPVQPGRDLASVEARVADELGRPQLERRETGGAALGGRQGVARRRVDDEDLGGPRRLVPDDREPRTVLREREARSEDGDGTLREPRRGEIGALLDVAHVQLGPAVVVLDPRDDTAVVGAGDLFDVAVRRGDPFPRAAAEAVKGEAGELAALVAQEIEARAVLRPRAGRERHLALV